MNEFWIENVILVVVSLFGGYVLTRIRDYTKNNETRKNCKKHLNYDLNQVLDYWIDYFKIYNEYLEQAKEKTLWTKLQEKNQDVLKALNLTIVSSQFEHYDIMKSAGVLMLLPPKEIHHIASMKTMLEIIKSKVQNIRMNENQPDLTEVQFYGNALESFLKHKIQYFESALTAIVLNTNSISWVEFDEQKKKFLKSHQGIFNNL